MNIFENKTIFNPTWKLEIITETGWYNNNTWQPGPVPGSENWLFSARYDDQILMNCVGVQEKQSVQCTLDDDHKNRNHNLIMVLRGNDTTKSEAVKISLIINDVDASEILKHYMCYGIDGNPNAVKYVGQPYMTHNGDQKLPIQTPIYRWMYDRRNLLIEKYWILKFSE